MAIIRVLRTAKATLSRTFYLDEAGQDATGNVAVSITRLDGTIVESGVATSTGGGTYTYTFGGRDVVDELLVEWSGTFGGDAIVVDQDRIQVVGGFYFGLAEGRDTDPILADTTKFTTADLAERRIQVESECERITGQAWVPRFARDILSGSATTALMLSHALVRSVRSVTVSGTAWTVDQVAGLGFSPSGMLYLNSAWPAGVPYGLTNIVVEYEHGHDAPDPEIVRAAKLRFKSLVLEGRSAFPDRAERVVTQDAQGGTVVYGSPSAERTGLPAVDAIYGRYPSPRPGFG